MVLVVYATSIIMSEMRVEFLSGQVSEDIPIPRVISGDEKDMYIW